MNDIVTIDDKVLSMEDDFNKVNHYQMSFKKEAMFAIQHLKSNEFLLKTARNKPESLENALMNIAAIGITLNPALKEAYLVPRGGQICLDISYMGLVKLATDTGSVTWVQAEIVKEKDDFEFISMGNKPKHVFNPFKDRGEMIGAYCVAKLSSGDYLTTIMSKTEIEEIKIKSSQAAKSGPWISFYEEMAKKTVIKRASKLWTKSERLHSAVDVLNAHEGIDFNVKKAYTPESSAPVNNEDFALIRNKLLEKNKDEGRLLKFISAQFSCEVNSIEEMTPDMVEATFRAIGGR